jgi:hypothetical protein
MPFQKGQSGNPRGRRPGVRLRITVLAEQMMRDDMPEVVRSVIAAARGGDMQAAKLILDRIAPLRRGGLVRLALPEMRSVEDLPSAVSAVAEAVAKGHVSPEEAAGIAAVIETLRRCFELTSIEARLRALEERSHE